MDKKKTKDKKAKYWRNVLNLCKVNNRTPVNDASISHCPVLTCSKSPIKKLDLIFFNKKPVYKKLEDGPP